jgi:hypothetical protein
LLFLLKFSLAFDDLELKLFFQLSVTGLELFLFSQSDKVDGRWPYSFGIIVEILLQSELLLLRRSFSVAL